MNALFPRHWPVRLRITAISAGLTALILLGFALIVGRLATDKIEGEFRDDLVTNANQLASQVASQWSPVAREPGDARLGQAIETGLLGDARVALVDSRGVRVMPSAAPDLGPPKVGEVTQVGPYEVAAQQVPVTSLGAPADLYVQYARPHASLDATVGRLWLLLASGVAGGALLAALAGFAVATRAMSPIASLTKAAREVAATRDPSRRLPAPETEDEVGELARTLAEMLRELDASRAETEQMVQAQREFVADASHELRTPLTSILANLELLQAELEKPGADPEQLAIVEAALGSSRRMRRLVSDLLLLARADAGRSGPRVPCDLTEIASAAIAEVRALADEHRIELHSDGAVATTGNPDDLHRLVLNLVENAVRHTPAGTAVAVSVREDGGDAVLEVADDGPGLPPGIGDQIFSRFVRGSGPADLSRNSGTGLGLAIVKAVATAHGGTVTAGESPHGGALFTVRLPAATVDEETLTPAPERV